MINGSVAPLPAVVCKFLSNQERVMKRQGKTFAASIFALLAIVLLVSSINSLRARASISKPVLQSAEIAPTRAGLDGARSRALAEVYAQYAMGGLFSAHEAVILDKFAVGAIVTELEADIVISRALYE